MFLCTIFTVFAQSEAKNEGMTLTSSLSGSVVSANGDGADFQFSVSMDLGTTSLVLYGTDESMKKLTWSYNEFPSTAGEIMLQEFSGKEVADTAVTFRVGSYGKLELYGYESETLIVSVEVTVKSLQGEEKVYIINDGELNLVVGDTKELTLYYDGTKYEGEVKWDITSDVPLDNPIAVINGNIVYAAAEGSCQVVALVDGVKVASASVIITKKKTTPKYSFYTGDDLQLIVGDTQWQCLFVYDEMGESTMYEGVVEWNIENEKTEVIALQDAETSYAINMSANAIGSAKLSAKVDGEVVAEMTVRVRDSYKLLPETFTLEASGDTITYYVLNSQGDTVKPYSYELQRRWLDNQPHIEHGLATDGYGIMVWGTGYDYSEGSLYVSVEDRGNVYENVIYQLISSEYTGERYVAQDVSLIYGGDSQDLVILDSSEERVALPDGFYIDYDTNFVSIKDGKITPLKYGQQSLRIVGKSGVMSSFNVTVTSESGYAIEIWSGEQITVGDELYIDLQRKEDDFAYLQSVDNPTFVSNAEDIATCEGNMLHAVAPGVAIITAMVDKEPVAEISITVVAKEVITYKVSPSEGFELTVGETQDFTLYVGDSEYTGDIEWIVNVISDGSGETGKELAKFDGNILYANKPGLVQVFAMITTGEYNKQTIQGPIVEILKAKDYSFSFEKESYTIVAGTSSTLSLLIGSDLKLDDVVFTLSSTNEQDIMVSTGQSRSDIVVYSEAPGDYEIAVSFEYGDERLKAVTTVLVEPVASYQIGDGKYSLTVGNTKELILYKNDAVYEGDIEWNVFEDESGSAPCVELFDNVMSALHAGSCIVEAKVDGKGVATAPVTVSDLEVIYSLEEEKYVMNVGNVRELILYKNDNVYEGAVTWKVEDYQSMIIAEVDEYGYLHANYEGVTMVYALIDDNIVAQSSLVIEGSGNSKSIGFTEPGYSVTEGETTFMCLDLYGFDSGFTIDYELSSEDIASCEFYYESNCFKLEGLTTGRTMLYVTLNDGEDKYTASAAISVNAKPIVHFDQEKYFMSIGDEVTAKLVFEQDITLPEDDAMKVEFENKDLFEILEINKYSVTFKALQTGTSSIFASIYEGAYTATSKVIVGEKIIIPEDTLPAPSCDFRNNIYTVCTSYALEFPDGISMDRMIFSEMESEDIVYQWYNTAGEPLEKVPVIYPTQIGSFTYYVSQKMRDGVDMVNGVIYYESEKIPVTLNIPYVPAPTINMYDQKICNGEDIKPFVVNKLNNMEAYWYDEDWKEIATGFEFVPTNIALGKRVYTVIVRDTNWCESKELQVSLVNGFVEKPAVTLLADKNEFAPNEDISFVAKAANDNIGIIWSVNNTTAIGNEFKTKFGEVGEYGIVCKAVDQETGCSASDTQKVVVKEVVIPVEAIEIVQKDYDLYVGESAMIEYHIIPEHATNKNVNVRYTSTGSTDAAIVRGMKISAVADGTEMIVISSDDNPEVTAECFVRVHNKVKGENIVMPSLITLEVGSSSSVNVVVTPSNATYNTVYFKEKEDDIISITSEGNILAKSAGTSTISAYTEEGLYATATVYVTEETKTITNINVPSEVILKKGESMAISYSIEPVSLAIKEITWTMNDEEIASFEEGIIKANNVGETTLTASVAGISQSIKIIVYNSNAPVLNLPTMVNAPVSVANHVGELKSISLGQASIDLSEFISDDSTAFENLKIELTTSPADLGVSNSGPIYVIDGKGMEGPATINLSVTDIDGLTTIGSFVVNFVKEVNKAPEILVDTLVVKYGIPSYFDLAALAQDDFTSTSVLEFTFGSAEGIETKIVDKRLVVTADYGSKEFNNIDMRVVDAYGTAASKTIVVNVASLPNKAPVIAVVPNQLENDTIPFGTFNLNDYVSDDYTAPSDIIWTVTSSENIAVRISNGVAIVKVLNEFWNGAEVITFTATDEEGLSSSVDVYYIRNISQVTYEQQKIETNAVAPVWEGAPTVSIMTMRQIGVPNQEFVLMANISSFDCTWEWIIDGADGIDQTSMLQSVTFKNPGLYTVKMKVMSADGQHVVEAELPVQLTVVGIENHDIAICQGDAVELNAIGDVNSLLWSTDEISSSIFVRPSTTTKYTLTMKKGMFTMTDEVTVNVSLPVSLMEDSVMCAGTEFNLEVQGEFESYSWNTGDMTKAIVIPAEVATYIVYATDANKCLSVDTFNIKTINPLPVLNIAKDANLTPCDGEEVTLNAGAGYAEYAWTITQGENVENINKVETVTVDTTSTISAVVVDENGCIGSEGVTVNFKYPYAEQIGVATFSETTDHIILAWEKTIDVNTVKYRIERETDMTDNWEQVGEDVMFDEAGLVVDEDVNYKQRAYKYRLVTTDGCNNEAISEVHRSMIATYQTQDNGLKTIQWCAYEPMSMITQYLVLRGTDVTAMDTVDRVPASNLYEIWNEVDPQFKNVKDLKYRVVFRLKEEVNENKYNALASVALPNQYDEQILKAESGPFALALSNIAEAENTTDIEGIPFADVVVYPTAITSVINVAIASNVEKDFEIEVVNTNGQSLSKIHTGTISKAIIQIPAEVFAQGMYNVKISDGTQTKAFKVTK